MVTLNYADVRHIPPIHIVNFRRLPYNLSGILLPSLNQNTRTILRGIARKTNVILCEYFLVQETTKKIPKKWEKT